MAEVKELEVETTRLSSDIENLRQHLNGMRKSGSSMMELLNQLGTMWEGEAKNAFAEQFTSDYETLCNMADVLEDLIKDLEEARTRYDSCERDVGSVIETMRV